MKMKALKKAAATTMALALGVSSVTACGTKSVTMPQESKDIAKLADERTAELDSFELKGTGALKMDVTDTKVDVDMDINAVYFKDPMKMKMDIKMVNNADDAKDDEKEMTVSMYFMKEDDNYVMYAGTTATKDGSDWTKTTMSKDDPQYKDLIEKLDKGLTSGSEDDTFADLYTKADNQPDDQTLLELKLTGEKIAELVDKSGADLSSLSQMGISTDMFKQLKDISVTMGVDNENVYWKSFSIDLKDVIQGVFDTVLEQYKAYMPEGTNMNMNVDKCELQFTYENYNNATDFELPDEAKNATEADLSNALTGSGSSTSDNADTTK